MPRRPTDRQLFEELLSRYEPMVREAFLAAVDDIRNGVTLRVIAERLERGDVHGAIEAMGLEPEAFARLERAIAEAYNAGGEASVGNMPALRDVEGNRVLFRWAMRNLAGEDWLRQHSSTMVTRIVEDQRIAIRSALEEGLSRGENPRNTALNVVGRIDRVSNRRSGGIIGLTAAQERYVATARQQLLSGDPDQMSAYLARGRRDKRFDPTIAKAIREGRPLPAAMVDRIVGRYADRLLELRGEMLARTETMMALGQSRHDAFRQQVVAGKIDADLITKTWRSAGDRRVRHTHRALNGKKVDFEAQFVSPSGAVLRFPGDPQGPVHEISGCRCWCDYKIDHTGALLRRGRF